jgi:hypothetical protein
VTGLALTQVAEILELTGSLDASARERCYELGATVAVTLAEDA